VYPSERSPQLDRLRTPPATSYGNDRQPFTSPCVGDIVGGTSIEQSSDSELPQQTRPELPAGTPLVRSERMSSVLGKVIMPSFRVGTIARRFPRRVADIERRIHVHVDSIPPRRQLVHALVAQPDQHAYIPLRQSRAQEYHPVDESPRLPLVPSRRRSGNSEPSYQSVQLVVAGAELIADRLTFDVRLNTPVERLQAACSQEPMPIHQCLPAIDDAAYHNDVRRFHSQAPS
jgi:hypothetical protein